MRMRLYKFLRITGILGWWETLKILKSDELREALERARKDLRAGKILTRDDVFGER